MRTVLGFGFSTGFSTFFFFSSSLPFKNFFLANDLGISFKI
jgi:hypothetical protein